MDQTQTRKPNLYETQHNGFWKYKFRKFILNRRLSRDGVGRILLFIKWNNSESVSMYEPKFNKCWS